MCYFQPLFLKVHPFGYQQSTVRDIILLKWQNEPRMAQSIFSRDFSAIG